MISGASDETGLDGDFSYDGRYSDYNDVGTFVGGEAPIYEEFDSESEFDDDYDQHGDRASRARAQSKDEVLLNISPKKYEKPKD